MGRSSALNAHLTCLAHPLLKLHLVALRTHVIAIYLAIVEMLSKVTHLTNSRIQR